jgi:hypothetical protein
MGDAMDAGTVTVDEVSEGGAVPHVRVRNDAAKAVLFLFGEEILGAKQNRVANASFLVPAGKEVVLDVSCVEAGRWSRRRGQHFGSSERVISHALRRRMARNVRESRALGQRFDADQQSVWQQVDERLDASGVSSPTGSYSDYAESRRFDLDEISEAFSCLDGQVGFVACIGGQVVGLEAIGCPEVFRASFQKLLHSCAVDAVDATFIEHAHGLDRPGVDSPEDFVRAVAETPFRRGPSLGAGEDLRLAGPRSEGCALVVDGALVHLQASPVIEEPSPSRKSSLRGLLRRSRG